jgi:GTP-binding protein HflX
MQREVNEKPIYAIAAAVQLPNVSDIEFEASLSELRELAKTLGFTVVRTFIQKRNGFDTTAYLGVGKRQEIHHYVNHEAECEIEAILVDHEISPSQARNLEKEVGCEVMDRTMVILEIFHRNARSRAARAQVEIARLGYMAPRLREAAKLAGPQGRQRSGVGGRGAGESQPRWTAARSATASPNCSSKSLPWRPSARPSAPAARSGRAWPAWRWSATPMPASRP